ncbi:hypothetical protein [Alienimonas chondri]|uniref:HEAT repeat domain-containing protein n=1 Tax=Alienimonas chondri TaxID=2681879 RepID=A0ABX1VCM6_9PLAN|nr:hypothetical protein [Alienimonas chondri]NNJ25887.1 hypothetical protein [Alienimonas chondri]
MRRPSLRLPSPVRGVRSASISAVALGLLAVLTPAASARQDDAPPGPAEELGAEVEAEAEADAVPDEAAPDDAGPKTGPALPRGIQPPPAKPASFTTVTPLMSEAELEELGAAVLRARYRDALEAGPTNAANKEVIQNWAKWRVAQLAGMAPLPEVDEDEEEEDAEPPEPRTMVEDRAALDKVVTELLRDANNYIGPPRGGRNVESAKLATFPILVAELVKLKDNHLVLRTQAIKVLSRLEVAGDGGGASPFKRYGPGIAQLLEIYKATGDETPELAVKYQAAQAIAFVAENGRNVPGNLQFEAAKLFASDLAAHPEYPGWMQGGLATATARMNLREASLGTDLMTALTDESRPFEARTRAAAAIVRLPSVPADVKSALPKALEDLGRSMARSYNARPSTEHVENFRTLEFAFKPVAPSEADRLQSGAILSGTSVPSELLAAYGRLHPLVKHVAGQDFTTPVSRWTPIPADLLANAGVGADPAG